MADEGSRSNAGLPESAPGEADRPVAAQVVLRITAEAGGGRTAVLAVLDLAGQLAGFCPEERLKAESISWGAGIAAGGRAAVVAVCDSAEDLAGVVIQVVAPPADLAGRIGAAKDAVGDGEGTVRRAGPVGEGEQGLATGTSYDVAAGLAEVDVADDGGAGPIG